MRKQTNKQTNKQTIHLLYFWYKNGSLFFINQGVWKKAKKSTKKKSI